MNTEKIILETAKKTIRIEAVAVSELEHTIDQNFVEGVLHLLKSEGRIVVTGIGKSAIIAQKIVATLNSTGSPAIFMHASDAIHGDLGMIRQQDSILCLSKSGETAEIKVLIPLIKNFGNKIFAICSERNSFLARESDFLFHTPVGQEADPNNLAPTASTTAQLAIGDALASALLAVKGFTSKDFAQYHPGGSLGKKLFLRVSDLYIRHARPSVNPLDHIKKVILEMTSKRLGATAVLDSAGLVIGIITDGDLRRMLEKSDEISRITAGEIMTKNPKKIESDAMAVEAFEIMRTHNITQLLVVDKENYLGMVHIHDLLDEGIL